MELKTKMKIKATLSLTEGNMISLSVENLSKNS